MKIPSVSPLACAASTMICSGDFTGRGRSTIPLTIPKIAVLAPMPSASVRITIAVSMGDFASILKA